MANEIDLSVVILTKNESELIGRCLASVALLHPSQVLVVDDDSSDDTREIAKNNGAQVFLHQKKDFAEMRNFGLSKCTSTWVLYVDADEEVSPKLADEIMAVLALDAKHAAYRISRVNYYLGTRWPYTEKVTRLFKRDQLERWFGELHESPMVLGETGDMLYSLLHRTHRSLVEMVENTNNWSAIEAKLRFDAGHPPISWWRLPRVMVPVFLDYYLVQGGWRVGTVGLIESIYQAFSIFITYAKLWEMQQAKKRDFPIT